MEIGEKIRKLRTDASMTQDELAAKLLVTRTAVSKWETGRGWPGVDSLKLIADEFGVSIDSLVSDEDVQLKRDAEDRRSLRLYFAAIACAVAAALAAAIGMSGVFDLPPAAAIACRWVAVWGMIGYAMLSFAFSRAGERVSKRRVLASRIVVVLIVLVVMMGFVDMAGTLSAAPPDSTVASDADGVPALSGSAQAAAVDPQRIGIGAGSVVRSRHHSSRIIAKTRHDRSVVGGASELISG